jgi:hypothetical protein
MTTETIARVSGQDGRYVYGYRGILFPVVKGTESWQVGYGHTVPGRNLAEALRHAVAEIDRQLG